jgi:hypothetical protein
VLAFDGDLLLGLFQCRPLAIDHHLVGVGRVGLFGDQVDVIVLEHGQAPAEVTVVAQQGERVERLEVAVQLKPGADSSASYHTAGTAKLMCGSPASNGLPLRVRLPATAQALLPSNCGMPASPSASC